MYYPLLLHCLMLLWHSFTLYNLALLRHLISPDRVEEHLKRFGEFQMYFYTVWNFTIQVIFLIVAIVDESSKVWKWDLKTRKTLGRARSFLFSALVVPSTFTVITVFWVMWHIDRELIFPKAMDAFFPLWLNHMLHTFVVVPVILELLLPKEYHFVKFERAFKAYLIYAAVYQSLFISVYLRHGVWLYPIYKYFNWIQVLIYTLVQFGIGVVAQAVGLAIQNRKQPNLSKRSD